MIIIKIILIWFILTALNNAYLMTLLKLDLKKRDFPDEYQIKSNNRIDIQSKFQCAAFSTAYILRHFGIEAHGLELYDNFPCKMRSGCVYPKGIRTYLKQKGFKTNYYKGNLETLKQQISKGIPVIVFIKVSKGEKNLHYVPVVGYDKDYLYLAESLGNLVNCSDYSNGYNRKVAIDDFKKLWDIKNLQMPFYSNTYITVEVN